MGFLRMMEGEEKVKPGASFSSIDYVINVSFNFPPSSFVLLSTLPSNPNSGTNLIFYSRTMPVAMLALDKP